jgi:hypothetical protein
MTEQRIKRDLQKTLYFTKIEHAEEFIKRFYIFLVRYTQKEKKLPNPFKIAKLLISDNFHNKQSSLQMTTDVNDVSGFQRTHCYVISK